MTPVQLDQGLTIGESNYELYRTIVHSGEDGSRGHYFTIGKRSEPTPSGDTGWYRMDERTVKPAGLAETRLLAGKSSTWECENTAYVVFRLRRWLKKTRIKRGSSEELDQQIILASACFTVTAYIVLSLSRRFTTGEYSWSELVSPSIAPCLEKRWTSGLWRSVMNINDT
jgi:hypothetical protein